MTCMRALWNEGWSSTLYCTFTEIIWLKTSNQNNSTTLLCERTGHSKLENQYSVSVTLARATHHVGSCV